MISHPDANPMSRYALPAFLDTTRSRMAETPLLTYFTPTFKCPGGYYCRAEMTAYEQFDGMTVVAAGYSVWAFSSPSEPITQYTIDNILKTSDDEISSYIRILAPLIYESYPYPEKLCNAAMSEAVAAFREGIEKMVECTKTTDYVCEKDVTIDTC